MFTKGWKLKIKKRGILKEIIIRILLNNPDGITKYRISKLSGASYGWTHEYLKKLESSGLVKGTKVVNYKALIYMLKFCMIKPARRQYLLRGSTFDFLKQVSLKYALTTYAAENLVQKNLFPTRFDFYIMYKDVEKWHQAIMKSGGIYVHESGNARILITDDHVFDGAGKVGRLDVVSVPQLIVDLLNEGGICNESAEHLLQKQ